MKSFKRYLKEKVGANNASFASAGSSPATKFSGIMGFGSVSGDGPSANKPGKGEGKDISPEITAAVAAGVKRNNIVRDKETGAVQFRGMNGQLYSSPHAAIAASRPIVKAEMRNVPTLKTVNQVHEYTEVFTDLVKTGNIQLSYGQNGKISRIEYRSGDQDPVDPDGRPFQTTPPAAQPPVDRPNMDDLDPDGDGKPGPYPPDVIEPDDSGGGWGRWFVDIIDDWFEIQELERQVEQDFWDNVFQIPDSDGKTDKPG